MGNDMGRKDKGRGWYGDEDSHSRSAENFQDSSLDKMGEPLSPNVYFSLQIKMKLPEWRRRIGRIKYAMEALKKKIKRIKKRF